jgi:Transposase DDE domain group 1
VVEEGTLQATNSRPRFEVTCDGDGVVSRAGTALLAELADRLGLTAALSWRPGRGHIRRHRHDPGAVLRDLAVVLADGGDCLSDLAVLRDQPELFGPVASTATAWAGGGAGRRRRAAPPGRAAVAHRRRPPARPRRPTSAS